MYISENLLYVCRGYFRRHLVVESMLYFLLNLIEDKQNQLVS